MNLRERINEALGWLQDNAASSEDLHLQISEAERMVELAKEFLARREAEIIQEKNGNLGSNDFSRKSNLLLALADDPEYQKRKDNLKQAERHSETLEAEKVRHQAECSCARHTIEAAAVLLGLPHQRTNLFKEMPQ